MVSSYCWLAIRSCRVAILFFVELLAYVKGFGGGRAARDMVIQPNDFDDQSLIFRFDLSEYEWMRKALERFEFINLAHPKNRYMRIR